jgi:hypothetical protein
MTKTVTVYHAGIEFTVSGEYAPYVPENFMDPAEGGCFEDCQIFINDEDATDILTDAAISAIIEKAEVEIASDDDEPEPEYWKD